jgi:hypothetical protein
MFYPECVFPDFSGFAGFLKLSVAAPAECLGLPGPSGRGTTSSTTTGGR